MVRIFISLILSLWAGLAYADQTSITIPESQNAFNAAYGTSGQVTFGPLASRALNPALKTIASNFAGTNCAGIATPVAYQWCVDTTAKTVRLYTPDTGGNYAFHDALTIASDGTVSPSNGAGGAGGVSSVAGKTGAVTLTVTDISGALAAASPTFIGTMTGPSATLSGALTSGTATTTGATTAGSFVTAGLARVASLEIANSSIVADSVTDISTALNSALAAGGRVLLPATNGTAFYRASATIVVPPGSTLEGGGDASMPTTIYKGGSKIVCDATVSPCILNGANVTGGASGRISNISQSRAGSTPSAASGYIGIQNMAGLNNKMDHVTADNNSICYLWRTPPGTNNGISFVGDYLFSSRCSDVHVWQDGWPEIRIGNSRFGSNGGEVASNTFIRESCTQHNCSGAGAPNTMAITNTQFNTNGSAVLKFLELTDLGTGIETSGGPDAGLPAFTNVHAENFMQFLTSDNSWDAARDLRCSASSFYVGSDTFALNASTSVDNWNLNGCNFIGTGAGTFTFNLNPSGNSVYTGTPKRVLTRLQMNGGIIGGAGTITGQGASNSMASFMGVSHGGTFTLAGRWANLSVVGGNWTAGNLTDSTNTADDVTIMENNVLKFHGSAGITCAAGLSATTGRTYKGLVTAC